MSNTILQITKVSPGYVDHIKESFNDLPETDHADGNYRLRKYSHVCVTGKDIVTVKDLNIGTFTQSSEYNQHQGDKVRDFNSIHPDVLSTPGLSHMAKVFRDACNLEERFTMDIHQMRVRCTGGATQLSPEGWHQDGYDCIAMIGIDRCNIIGGEVLLSTSKTESPFMQAVIECGTMVIVDDTYLWHNGRSIQSIDNSKPAYMDILIFTAKK
jgi:hypothetical protein